MFDHESHTSGGRLHSNSIISQDENNINAINGNSSVLPAQFQHR